ncbi:MAG: nicotinate-nucleotide--dimethylbenzimidazole phosphoribosyltransferase [Nakamurella sp.]
MSTELTPFAQITPPSSPDAGPADVRTTGGADPSLGRLTAVADWFARRRDDTGVLVRPRVVVVAGDHGSATGDDRSDRDLAVGELLAAAHGAGWHRIDVASHGADIADDDVISAGHPDAVVADVLAHDDAIAAVELGRRLADREIDAGADLLIPGLTGSGHGLPLGVLTAVLTGLEPIAAVTVPDTDPTAWVAAVTDLRDTLFRLRDRHKDVVSLIAAVGGADLGVLAGLIAQAAVRRTPVLLDGLPATIAAVLAHRLAPGADAWFIGAGQAVDRPGRRLQDMLGLPLVADLATDSPGAAGAVLVLPLIQAALAVAVDHTTTFVTDETEVLGPVSLAKVSRSPGG